MFELVCFYTVSVAVCREDLFSLVPVSIIILFSLREVFNAVGSSYLVQGMASSLLRGRTIFAK